MADNRKNNRKSGIGAVISFILLIGAAVALFYFGWVQFELPENTYAVLFSKTSGYDSEVLEPGHFNWKWERILPTNSKLIKFKVESRSVTLEYTGSLPSAELYSSTIPEQPDFSYNMTFLLTYRLKEDLLPSLLEEGIIENGDLESFYHIAETEYLRIIKDESNSFFIENLTIDNSSYGDLETVLLGKINSRYSYIDVRNFVVKYVNYPDLELYSKSRDLYHQILDRRKETEIATEKWAIESKVNLDTKIEILTKYGELLSKYPILVEYFALDPESQVLDISNLKDYNYSTESSD